MVARLNPAFKEKQTLTTAVLITGGSGQVGGALKKRFQSLAPATPVYAPPRSELDLSDAASIRNWVREVRPRWIVSSAAYTAVDAAETDRDAAFAANAIAPGILAEEAARLGSLLIHLSTDYVFPGTGSLPWVETDATDPLNVYGASKLAGEQAIAASGAAHVILRTSWVYSSAGKNFVRTMFRLLSTRNTPLRVVSDQHGAPTSADDLADAIFSVIEQTGGKELPAVLLGQRSGVYHCAGSGETTWFGLASAVRDFLTAYCTPAGIEPVPSAEYPTPAARPSNSRLNCGKLAGSFRIVLPEWRASLQRVLNELTATDFPESCPSQQDALAELQGRA